MADYVSNTPVSKPTVLPVSEDADFGGMSWNNEIGLYFPTTDDMPPYRPPIDQRASDPTRRRT